LQAPKQQPFRRRSRCSYRDKRGHALRPSTGYVMLVVAPPVMRAALARRASNGAQQRASALLRPGATLCPRRRCPQRAWRRSRHYRPGLSVGPLLSSDGVVEVAPDSRGCAADRSAICAIARPSASGNAARAPRHADALLRDPAAHLRLCPCRARRYRRHLTLLALSQEVGARVGDALSVPNQRGGSAVE